MDSQPTSNKVIIIKNVYFYLVSFVALMMMAISLGNMISSLLRAYVFTRADYYGGYAKPPGCDAAAPAGKDAPRLSAEECAKLEAENKQQQEDNRLANLQRSAVNSISFFVIGLPLFILHWRVAKRKEGV